MNTTIDRSRSHPVNLWPYRLWCDQAQRLYPGNPHRQRLAILEHIDNVMDCTADVQRWLWLVEIGGRLAEHGEVAP